MEDGKAEIAAVEAARLEEKEVEKEMDSETEELITDYGTKPLGEAFLAFKRRREREAAAGAPRGRIRAAGTFSVEEGNGCLLLIDLLTARKWKRLKLSAARGRGRGTSLRQEEMRLVQYPREEDWRLLKRRSSKLRLFNHVFGVSHITHKHGLLTALQAAASRAAFAVDDIVPATAVLHTHDARELLDTATDSEQLWVIKPVNSCKGQGVRILSTASAREAAAEAAAARSGDERHDCEAKDSSDLLLQRYVLPLLLREHKMDLRVFVLIAQVNPPVVLFHRGFLRRAVEPWSAASPSNAFAHLTNVSVSKKHADWPSAREDLLCDVAGLAEASGGDAAAVARCWADVHRAVRAVWEALQPYLRREGSGGMFELLAFDFAVSSAARALLLEVNRNADIEIHCEQQRTWLPALVGGMFDVVFALADGEADLDELGGAWEVIIDERAV
eukprot:PLAT15848.1.p1 GENE.PLAT15848.1~~PLAT15848.1.p1  ORF type:complete len:445 (+),score=137.48 PLAT15848.1:69-1403(+)